jgi:hypothetical protein
MFLWAKALASYRSSAAQAALKPERIHAAVVALKACQSTSTQRCSRALV